MDGDDIGLEAGRGRRHRKRTAPGWRRWGEAETRIFGFLTGICGFVDGDDLGLEAGRALMMSMGW